MRYELEVADRVLEATGQIAIDARDVDWPVVARKPKWDVVKVVATTEAAMSVTDQAFRLVGGSAFRRGHVLERLHRDARAGYLHAFNTNQLCDFTDRLELGLAGQLLPRTLRPPSMTRVWPVTYAASCDSRNPITDATFSGGHSRPRGTWAASSRPRSAPMRSSKPAVRT